MFGPLVALAVLLGAHGEGSREEKFRGTLVAQGESQALDQEIASLTARRPTFTGANVAMVIGVVLSIAGGPLFFVGLALISSTDLVGLVLMIAGLAALPVGIIVGLVSAFAMFAVGADLRAIDNRIEQLQRARPPVAHLPLLGRPLVLARF